MSGRHEGPPAGSGAREATASPYIGKRRAPVLRFSPAAQSLIDRIMADEDEDDPPRCWSCGHRFGDGCECSCCNDDHDGGPDDV